MKHFAKQIKWTKKTTLIEENVQLVSLTNPEHLLALVLGDVDSLLQLGIRMQYARRVWAKSMSKQTDLILCSCGEFSTSRINSLLAKKLLCSDGSSPAPYPFNSERQKEETGGLPNPDLFLTLSLQIPWRTMMSIESTHQPLHTHHKGSVESVKRLKKKINTQTIGGNAQDPND